MRRGPFTIQAQPTWRVLSTLCCTLGHRVRPETASGRVPKWRQRATGGVDLLRLEYPDAQGGSIDGYTEARLRRKLWRVMFPDEALTAYFEESAQPTE